MKDSPKNIKWHPAFCSAAKVEMREDAEYLTWLDEAERKGEVRGISQGISQGELQGKEKKQRQVIFNMYRDNFTLQQIARVVDLSIDAVKQILNSDNKMKI